MCSESIGRSAPLGVGAAAFPSAFGSSASVPGRLASRAKLLAGASLLALAALASPGGGLQRRSPDHLRPVDPGPDLRHGR